ncbi:glutathione peroxidase [Mariniluteicoccus flavus]
MTTFHDFNAITLTGTDKALADYSGQVALVVNTASKCGLTPQFEGLEELHQRFGDRGLVVLGFPCDQFANQEPGTDAEIGEFCSMNYGVTFPMFSKIDVNGPEAHPVFRWLKEQKKGVLAGTIKWNFTKFLIGRDGQVIKRYAPTTQPEAIAADIEKALGQSA